MWSPIPLRSLDQCELFEHLRVKVRRQTEIPRWSIFIARQRILSTASSMHEWAGVCCLVLRLSTERFIQRS